MSELYEVRASPGKGLGVFATRKIAHGTQILADECTLLVPKQEDRQNKPFETYTAFLALHPNQQQAFLNLTHNAGTLQQYVQGAKSSAANHSNYSDAELFAPCTYC